MDDYTKASQVYTVLNQMSMTDIEGLIPFDIFYDNEEIVFDFGTFYYKIYHEQDCCETVVVDDICGDFNDLVGHPLTTFEERSGHYKDDREFESVTWTFYEFAGPKGSVNVRWCGESNGYYSESVHTTAFLGDKCPEEFMRVHAELFI